MDKPLKINEEVTIGPQPSEGQLQELKGEGFNSVVNFRTEDEEDQPLSPDAEGEKVKGLGMDFMHVPVSMKTMGPEVVHQFRHKYPSLKKPVFAHCKSGKRAGAMVMMHLACENGMTGEQTVQRAKDLGFECDQPELVEFVTNYVNTHTKAS